MPIELTSQGTEYQAMTPLRVDAGDTVVVGNVTATSSHSDVTATVVAINAAAVTIGGAEYPAGTVAQYTLATTAVVAKDRESYVDFTYTTQSGDVRKVRETITVKPHFAVTGGTAVYGGGQVTSLTTAPAAALYPGIYDVDTSGGAFTVELRQVKGVWLFLDPTGSTASDNLTIGTSGQTFNGTAGPLTWDGSAKEVRVYNTGGSTAYKVTL